MGITSRSISGLLLSLAVLFGGAMDAHAFVDCAGDPTRTILAGFQANNSRPCRIFDGDPAICAQAYYTDEDDGIAVACIYDDPDCEGTGGDGNDESLNTCLVQTTCTDDPTRTTHLGIGNTGDSPCRAQMDMVSCNASYYSNIEGFPVACLWDGSECDGCGGGGDGGSQCQKDLCHLDPTPPVCTLDPSRTNFQGTQDEPQRRCRVIPDQTTCDNSYYATTSGEPISCYWDGSECDGCGGQGGSCPFNSCTIPANGCTDPGRTNFLGDGDDGSAPCPDITDMATCNMSFYHDDDGYEVACVWVGTRCNGSNGADGGYNGVEKNPCNLDPSPPVCAGDPVRTNFQGERREPRYRCSVIDDAATCNISYYADSDGPISCHWTGIECVGCGGDNEPECLQNTCSTAQCPGDPSRVFLEQCSDISDPGTCAVAFHEPGHASFGASCYWNYELDQCQGCGPNNFTQGRCLNSCFACGNAVVDPGEQCDDGNPFDGDCCTSTCTLVANGTACTDRDYCTVDDGTCNNGVCAPGPARDCSAEDNPPCEVGVCDHFGRDCDQEALPVGAACDDTDACTSGDQCLGSNCTGVPLDCSAFDDACNVGTCTAGTCGASPLPDMTGCDDANECTSLDECTGGVCGGTNVSDGTGCSAAFGCQTGGTCTGGVCGGTMAVADMTPCDDNLFCNGTDSCAAGACTAHTGNPCEGVDGDDDCSETCDEAGDNCDGNDPAASICDNGSFCDGPYYCDGSGFCNGANDPDCSSLDGTCTVGTCDYGAGSDGACVATAGNFGDPCSDGNACTSGDQCGSASCSGGPTVTCDDDSSCTADSCVPATGCVYAVEVQTGCRAAGKSKFQYGNNSDDAKDKLKWKWGDGDPTTVTEFSDPTTTADYELCIYGETMSTPTLLLGADIAASNSLWSPVGISGYKYQDSGGTAGGITKAKLKGSGGPKSKIILKGKGTNLDDITLPLDPMFTGLRIQLTNQSNGICFESEFPSASITGDDAKLKASVAP